MLPSHWGAIGGFWMLPSCCWLSQCLGCYWRLLGEESYQHSYLAVNTKSFNNNYLGKMCPLVQWWHECFGGNNFLIAVKACSRVRPVPLIKSWWQGDHST